MRKRTLLTAVLTLVAAMGVAGCGGKSSSNSGGGQKSSTSTPGQHNTQNSGTPAY